MEKQLQKHTIPLFCPPRAQVLLLGSFPSVKSRESGFYYGHPQNRFWKILAFSSGFPVPESIPEKKVLLQSLKIALWDVIATCSIAGSSDASITGVQPNSVTQLLAETGIRNVFVNGKTADKLYREYIFPSCGIPATVLPSSSPANAAWSLQKLTETWKIALDL